MTPSSQLPSVPNQTPAPIRRRTRSKKLPNAKKNPTGLALPAETAKVPSVPAAQAASEATSETSEAASAVLAEAAELPVHTVGQILQSLLPKWRPAALSARDAASSSRSVAVQSHSLAATCELCTSLDRCRFPTHRGYVPIAAAIPVTALTECEIHRAWKAKRRHENLQNAANIPLTERSKEFGSVSPWACNREAYATAKASVERRESLYIYGPSQSGKTQLLSVIANEYLRRGVEAYYTTAAELFVSLRYNADGSEERMRRMQRVGVLVIDDLGSERVSEYSEEQLQMVLSGRAGNGLPTVCGSNRRQSELGERYRQEAVNRIKHSIAKETKLERKSTRGVKWSG